MDCASLSMGRGAATRGAILSQRADWSALLVGHEEWPEGLPVAFCPLVVQVPIRAGDSFDTPYGGQGVRQADCLFLHHHIILPSAVSVCIFCTGRACERCVRRARDMFHVPDRNPVVVIRSHHPNSFPSLPFPGRRHLNPPSCKRKEFPSILQPKSRTITTPPNCNSQPQMRPPQSGYRARSPAPNGERLKSQPNWSDWRVRVLSAFPKPRRLFCFYTWLLRVCCAVIQGPECPPAPECPQGRFVRVIQQQRARSLVSHGERLLVSPHCLPKPHYGGAQARNFKGWGGTSRLPEPDAYIVHRHCRG